MKLHKKSVGILASYGFSHMIVDFICAATIFTIYISGLLNSEGMFFAILTYNILAFGTQIIFGIIEDKCECPKLFAISGCGIVILGSLLFKWHPRISVILLGLGNSLFHVGGGIISIATDPEKASPSGIFVAPGALGLFLGTLLGKNGNFIGWYSIILGTISCLSMYFSSLNVNTYHVVKTFSKKEKCTQKQLQNFIILLITSSIIIRSFIGSIVTYPRKVGLLSIIFTVCIVLGKATGGIIADKFGWIRTGISSLLLSLPCLLLGFHCIIFGMIGIFLFNITMSIALAGLIKTIPNRWGFAFGILCMGLLIGSLPILLGNNFTSIVNILLIALILISSFVLYIALTKLGIKK